MRSLKLRFLFGKGKRDDGQGGVLDKIIMKRREWVKVLEKNKEQEKDLQVHWNVHSDIVIALLLFCRHDCYKS
jgi:hypothetical protein